MAKVNDIYEWFDIANDAREPITVHIEECARHGVGASVELLIASIDGHRVAVIAVRREADRT